MSEGDNDKAVVDDKPMDSKKESNPVPVQDGDMKEKQDANVDASTSATPASPVQARTECVVQASVANANIGNTDLPFEPVRATNAALEADDNVTAVVNADAVTNGETQDNSTHGKANTGEAKCISVSGNGNEVEENSKVVASTIAIDQPVAEENRTDASAVAESKDKTEAKDCDSIPLNPSRSDTKSADIDASNTLAASATGSAVDDVKVRRDGDNNSRNETSSAVDDNNAAIPPARHASTSSDKPHRSSKDSKETAEDPLASFFDDRPTVKDLEDSEEAAQRRRRNTDSGAKRSRSASRQNDLSKSRKGSRSRSARKINKLDEFIKDNELDEKVAGALRRMDPMQSQAIMAQGFDVRQCRNPSAVVMSRVQKLEPRRDNKRDARRDGRRDDRRDDRRGGRRESRRDDRRRTKRRSRERRGRSRNRARRKRSSSSRSYDEYDYESRSPSPDRRKRRKHGRR